MSQKTWFEKRLEEIENSPTFQAEDLRIDIIEQMLTLMEGAGITRADLARKLGCSNAYITKLLNGSENLTLLKLTQIASAIHSTVDISFVPRSVTLTKVFRQKRMPATLPEFNRIIKTGAVHAVDFPLAA